MDEGMAARTGLAGRPEPARPEPGSAPGAARAGDGHDSAGAEPVPAVSSETRRCRAAREPAGVALKGLTGCGRRG